jgi:hypothetical protein
MPVILGTPEAEAGTSLVGSHQAKVGRCYLKSNIKMKGLGALLRCKIACLVHVRTCIQSLILQDKNKQITGQLKYLDKGYFSHCGVTYQSHDKTMMCQQDPFSPHRSSWWEMRSEPSTTGLLT